MIYKEYKRGEVPVYERTKYRICSSLLGVLFILIGFCFDMDVKALFLDDLDQVPRADQYGPMILLACNKPNQTFNIFTQTDDVGKTDLLILWNESEDTSFEELKLWVVIDDYFAPFTWSIVDNALAMDIFAANGKNYRATSLGQTNGTDQHIGFLVNLKKGMAHTAHIALQTAEEDYIKKDREKLQLRIPIIMYWTRFKWGDSPPNILLDDSQWINKTIMGEDLFLPLMYVEASVSNLVAGNSNLVLNAVEPTGSYNERIISWTTRIALYPKVEYIDLEGYNKLKLEKRVAMVLFGMGLSCLTLAIRKRKGFKTRGINDRKKRTKHISKHM